MAVLGMENTYVREIPFLCGEPLSPYSRPHINELALIAIHFIVKGVFS